MSGYTVSRIDNLGRGCFLTAAASSGAYIRLFGSSTTLAAMLSQVAPNNRQTVTINNPSVSDSLNVVLAPAGENTPANVDGTANYPVFCTVPPGTDRNFQAARSIGIWVRSATVSAIPGITAVEGL